MHTVHRLVASVAAVAAVAAAAPTAASAADEPLGWHVAMCAQELGWRAGAPAVTCTHDGHTMTFPTFGAMVAHMRGAH